MRTWTAILALGILVGSGVAQRGPLSEAENAIAKGIGGLRAMPDDARAAKTRELALQIRELPDGASKVGLASSLTNLATEGYFGPGTLQSVADTLALAVKATPPKDGGPYSQLADLARFEDIKVSLDVAEYRKALADVDALNKERAKVDFTLTDLTGKSWTRSELKEKVVLVNFWATWCPPCKKEMPDIDALYTRFKDQGLVVLAISDEKVETVQKYLSAHPVGYPVLLDPGRKVNDLYKVDGIPKNLIYDRKGKLVAQSIDMRTMPQFLQLLAKAGLK